MNLLDATKGTAYFKFEHDPWAFRSDKSNFNQTSQSTEDGKTEPKWRDSKYNTFETYFDTKFKSDNSFKIKSGSSRVVEANFANKNLTFKCPLNCSKILFKIQKSFGKQC